MYYVNGKEWNWMNIFFTKRRPKKVGSINHLPFQVKTKRLLFIYLSIDIYMTSFKILGNMLSYTSLNL
jgi:hypothetical protein